MAMSEVNKITLRPIQPNDSAAAKVKQGQQKPFASVLMEQLNSSVSGIKFSKHAAQRLEERNITLTMDDLRKIEDTVARASQKGLKESLFVMQGVSMVVNIENKTVVTAMTNSDTKDGFVTNIDSVALL
jgi:flagellar operon protein